MKNSEKDCMHQKRNSAKTTETEATRQSFFLFRRCIELEVEYLANRDGRINENKTNKNCSSIIMSKSCMIKYRIPSEFILEFGLKVDVSCTVHV